MANAPHRPALPRTKLLVADARQVFREGLKHIVGACTDMEVVGEAATKDEVLEQVQATDPDVLILDLFLCGPSLLKVIRGTKRRCPRCRVLIVNVECDDPYALRILGARADGYLSKDDSPRQITEAIRHVARGTSYVSPWLASTLISGFKGGETKLRGATLSDREFQVIRMFASGIPFKEIAAELEVSPKTVSTYRSRILNKLGLHSNAEMIRYAIEHCLVPRSMTPPSRRRKSRTQRAVQR